MPPTMAIRLMISGAFQPCHSARLYSGSWPPTTGVAATASTWPINASGRVPTSRHSSTSSSIGMRIQRTGSCGSRGRFFDSLPKNTLAVKRSE